MIRSPEIYLIPRSDGRIVVGTTVEEAGFDKRTDVATIQRLHRAAIAMVPELRNAKILEDWAGLRPGTPDALPILGATATPGYYVATGHFRDGILLAPITARVMAQVIEGKNPDYDLTNFSPARFPGLIIPLLDDGVFLPIPSGILEAFPQAQRPIQLRSRTRKDQLMASPAVDFARNNQQRFLSELKDLLRIPSVSTLDEHKPDVQKAAEFVANELRRIGMENVEVIPTKGHPLIYADWLHAPGKPTVLCYAHYDVQPPDPLDEWHTPPFEPTERNNNIYARGAVDDKGQLWMEVKALESLMKSGNGKLPINVKIIFEGEEEVGGESIAEYVRKAESQAEGRFRPGLRHRAVRSQSSHALRRPARPGLYGDRSFRRQDRLALRRVRRRGSKSVLRADRNHQQAKGCQGPRADPRLLQGREGAQQR